MSYLLLFSLLTVLLLLDFGFVKFCCLRNSVLISLREVLQFLFIGTYSEREEGS